MSQIPEWEAVSFNLELFFCTDVLKLLKLFFATELRQLTKVREYYEERSDPSLFREHVKYLRMLFVH
jgi:hypothetical protein